MKEKFKRVVSSIKQILIRYINFIKLHKKQVLLSLGLLLMVFIPTFLYVNLTNPTKINKYIAHVINKGAPANEYFEDEIFYKVVVDAYNRKNNTSLPYTTNLTDEQLKTITSLSYSGYNKPDSEKISSAKGIEKLISLTLLILQHNNLSSIDVSKNTALISLELHYNNLSSIDVSHNVKLERLYLQDNNLNSIDVSKNAALKDLGLGNNNLSNIDVSKNTALKDLGLSNNNLSSIDLSQNTTLKTLYLSNNNLSSIDVSKNTALTDLGLGNNNLSNIDVSKNTALKDLGLGYNNLSSIDLSKNTELTELGLGYNNLSSIDVSKNTALKDLDLNYNKLSTIDLSENTSLWRLNLYNNNLRSIDVSSKALKILGLSNNNLSSIDLSKNTALMNLSIFSNNLSSIDLSKNTELTELDLDYNNLNNIVLYDKFDTSKLKSVIGTQYSNQININLGNNKEIKPIDSYKYYLGVKVVIPNEVDVNTFKENLGLNNLTVKIFNGETEKTTGQVKQNDILKIYDDGNLMQDIPINIMLSSYFEDNVFYKAVVDAYNSKNNTSLPYTTNLTDEQLKTITSLSYYGNNKPISERIYNAKGIERLTSLTHLDLSSNNISNIDLSKNASLTELDLSYNNISNIDLSKNMFLNKLYTNSNKLEYIDLSKNINLQYYTNRNVCNLYIYGSCDYNELNNIKLSDNILVALDLGYNSLSSIDLSKNTELTELDLSNNNISSIDLSKNTELTELDLSNNNISSIDLSKNTELTELILGYNNLNSIDVSHNVKLKYLYLHNNSLNSIDVSKNTSLTDLTLYDNPLILKKQRLLKGKSVSSNFISNIKLPEGSDKYFITYEMEDNTIASFSDNKITGLKSGKTNLVATLNGVKESGSSSSSDMRINGNILVYDLTSSKYDIKHDEKYIYVGADSISSSLDNIKLENISGKIEDNKLVLYDGDIKVDEYRLVGISSSTYDLSNEYIYTGTNTFDKSKITCINCTLEESNNTLNIKYGSTTLKSYKIVSYSSSTYDLSKDYIYIGINTFDKSKITCTNCTLEESGNTLNIKYGSTILKSYKLVSISSNKYDLSKDNIRLNKDEVFDINSISVINGTKEYSNNRLYIRYNSDILKVYNITYRLKGDVNNDGKITNADVSKLFAYYKGKIKLAEDDLSISDLNNDGKITNADVSKLFAYYKGKIKEL